MTGDPDPRVREFVALCGRARDTLERVADDLAGRYGPEYEDARHDIQAALASIDAAQRTVTGEPQHDR